MECLIHHLSNYTYAGKQSAKLLAAEHHFNQGSQFKKAAKIFELFNQEKLKDCIFKEIQEIAYEILPKEQFNVLIDYFKNQKLDLLELEWSYYANIAAIFKRNIRPLVLNLKFAATTPEDNLLKGLQFIKTQLIENGTLQKSKTMVYF